MEPASAVFPRIQRLRRTVAEAGAFQAEDLKTGGRGLEDTQMASCRRFEVVRTASGDGKEADESNACWMERMHTEELGFEREEGWREVQGNEFARISNM
jgi:hypothetical protein